MGLSFKNAVKGAVIAAGVNAATKVLTGTSAASSIQSALSGASNALNSIGQNLNNAINNGLGLPGVPNLGGPGGTGATNGDYAVDFTAGNNVSITNPNAENKNKTQISASPPFPNELHDFASYNCIWTLSALSRSHINFPDDSYKKGIIEPIIFKSGSGKPMERIALSTYTSPANPEGKYDYFIDNIRIKGVTGLDKMTGNTNSTGLEFNIIEPYSIGQFFQSLQVAASIVKYKNWVEMPLLLTLEFIGHKDPNNQNFKSIRKKHFPIKITGIEMKVTDRGSTYSCRAIPWNERAYSKQVSNIKNDINCTGSTVQEMLQKGPNSFQSVLNDALASQAIAQSQGGAPIVPDRVLILFPLDIATSSGTAQSDDTSNPPSATTSGAGGGQNNKGVAERLGVDIEGINFVQNTNVSPIGLADMGFIDQNKPEAVFGKDNAVWDPDKKVFVRGEITISSKEGTAKFTQGTSIPNVINQVILASEYGRNALDSKNFDNDGNVNWWRIDTQIYMLEGEGNMAEHGKYPFLTVYRVIPHTIHHSIFVKPDQPAATASIQKVPIKKYDYIYTSKNIDILDFSINFNTSFYTALTADAGRFNKDIQNRSQQASDATESKPVIENGKLSNQRIDSNGNKYDASEEYASGKYGNLKPGDTLSNIVQIRNTEISLSSNQGGPAKGDDPSTIAARQFHKAINTATDMVQLQMKILGDPFYLGDSGMGNYTAGETNVKGMNSDWAINYQRGQVFIEVNFRNPIDINHQTGLYDFPKGELSPSFSGLYRVGQVESTFDRGVFTQLLNVVRLPNQKPDGGPSVPPDTVATKVRDGHKPPKPISGVVSDDENSGEWT